MLATTGDAATMRDPPPRTDNGSNHERCQQYHTMLATNDAATTNDASNNERPQRQQALTSTTLPVTMHDAGNNGRCQRQCAVPAKIGRASCRESVTYRTG